MVRARADANPSVAYNNNDESKQAGSSGVGAGNRETDDAGRLSSIVPSRNPHRTRRGPSASVSCYAQRVAINQSGERQARAEQRRRMWSGGVVKLADMEVIDDEFWATMSPGERFVAVWEVSRESYESEATAGLRGSPHGLRRR